MTKLSSVPELRPFVSLNRVEPCQNQYSLMVYVKLTGYRVLSYDPEKFSYERIGGVNMRYTVMHIEKTGGEEENEFFKEYTVTPDRRYEDVLFVELVEEVQPVTQKIILEGPSGNDIVYYTQSLELNKESGGGAGGAGGSYEP